MLVLTIRTDQPQAEVSLFDGNFELDSLVWQAHRQLAETINAKISGIINDNQSRLEELEGIVVYKGPGSFTGLRIGVTVANALASGLKIPIVGTAGDGWKKNGLQRLKTAENDRQVTPEYGALPHVTQPKH